MWRGCGRRSMTLQGTVMLGNGRPGGARVASALVGTATLDHHVPLSGSVRHRPPSFRMPVDLRRCISVNVREPAAYGWGLRGRRLTRALAGACDDAVLHDSSPKARRAVRSGEPGLDWQVGLAAVVPADWGLSRIHLG